MRTAMRWVMWVTSFASLVLGVPFRADQKVFNPILSTECCDYEKARPLLLNKSPTSCSDSIIAAFSDSSEDTETESEQKCENECTLGEYGLLNEDKSIKEQELRELLVENAPADVKAVLNDVMDECFDDYNKSTVRDDTCKSGAEDLFQCILIGIFSNCPASMWNVTKRQCHGSKDKFMREVATVVTTG